ncbi:MAG: hypothetical protein SGJ09_04100 [Phycisphaerae bacterium]|nr:hypothetical protein [Phycisphaerae bacterium]
MHAFTLALRHLAYHRGRTVTIVLALALVAFLPLAIQRLVSAGSHAMMARAAATPLIVGVRGSELDLVIAGIYFATPAPRPMRASDAARLRDDESLVVPLALGFSAQKHPVVGTSLEYFDLRGLTLTEGRRFALLGECVVGASVAAALARERGPLLTDAIDPYNLAGTIPLKLQVVGTIAPTGTADDEAVFVDMSTTWTIAGLGHGHQGAAAIRDPNDLIGKVDGHVVASERLRQYEEITSENVKNFHFHGDPETFPVNAFIVRPADEKHATLLRGRFQRSDEPLQIVKPIDALERLLREILRLKQFLDVILIAVGAVTLTVVVLVFVLSVRLRRDELTTMVRLGAARGTVARLIIAELFVLFVLAGAVAGLGLVGTRALDTRIESLLLGR